MSMYKIVNGERIEMTEEEIKQLEKEQAAFEAYEKTRPFTQQEVMSMLLTEQINTLEVDDTKALRMKAFYPAWQDVIGKTVKQGFKFTYEDKLYKTIQPDGLAIQEQYVPGVGTESLYAVIDETHAGTQEDPIPYNGNMELEAGKYYTQDSVLYHCTTGTGQPVYQPLSELVGVYVERVDTV